MAAIVDLYEASAVPRTTSRARRHRPEPVRPVDARCCRRATCRPPQPKPFFDLLDRALSDEIRTQRQAPVLDRHGRPVAARGDPRQARPRHPALRRPRGQAYASNSHIFLIWMVGTSVVLLTVAILFLRNQIRPILRLAEAADAFGKGRPVPHDFRPRGAREVRQAAQAFLEMRERIRHHVEQRTTMLAGVSHDLRTVLTRFKLELALLGDSPEIAGAAQRRQRDAAHARGLSRLRQGRRRRGGGADQRRRAAGGGAGGDASTSARRSRSACASPSASSCCR